MTDNPLPAVATQDEVRAVCLSMIEAERTRSGEPELELDLSVNEWIKRIQGAAQQAHGAARAGSVTLELESWRDIAAIALGRMEQLLPTT